jgi:hypothetical protein
MAVDLRTIGHVRAVYIGDENGNHTGGVDNPLMVGLGKGLSAFGELLVVQPHPIFQYSFEYTVDNTDLTENVVVNGGTVIQADAMAVVASSTTTASSATLRTVRHAKYQAGQGGLCRFTGKFTAGIAGTEQYMGLLTEQGSGAAFKNGYAIGFDGADFGVHRFQNDVKITVALSDCDDPLDGSGSSGMVFDPAKINVFEIRFQYLGGGPISFHIEDESTGMFIRFHTIRYANLNTVPSVYNPNFHFLMWVANKATVSNITMSCGSCAYFVEGVTDDIKTHQPQNSSGLQSKAGVTSEQAIFTIRNKTTYNSKVNFIDIKLEALVCSIEASAANNLGSVRLIRDALLDGSTSYTNINTSDSVIDYDTGGTTVTAGKELLVIPLAGKNDKEIVDIVPYSIRLRHGQTITVAGISENSAKINASLLWKELF